MSKYLLLVLLILLSRTAFSQTVIDLRTGIFGNTAGSGWPLAIGSIDDTWQVSGAQPVLPWPNFQIPTSYQSLFVCNGVLRNDTCRWPPNIPPTNPGSRMISPSINSQGEAIGVLQGFRYYKLTFNYGECATNPESCILTLNPIRSATLNINWIGGGGQILRFIINGNLHAYWTPSLTIPANEINIGQNNIILVVSNSGGCGLNGTGWISTGLDIEGTLTIYNYNLADKDGNEKTNFCIGEDAFFNGGTIYASSYDVDLLLPTSNTPLASMTNIPGSPAWFNITDLFSSAPNNISFQPGWDYIVKVTANTPCGLREYKKQFRYVCCNSSTDASFDIAMAGGEVKGNSPIRGTHEWKFYNAQTVNSGPYELFGTFNTQNLIFPVTGQAPCYRVTHKLTTTCGENCTSQTICDLYCENGDCELSAPTGLASNGDLLSWNATPGATSYILEIIACDYLCCGGPPDAVLSHSTSITVQGTAYTVSGADFINMGIMGIPCFSWRVYAICPTGKRSQGSQIKCGGGVCNAE